MNFEKLKIEVNILAEPSKVWDYYTNPKHIVNWNFADPSWHCPKAENDMVTGGKYVARMEAKDGSFGFDFEAIYTEVIIGKSFSYQLSDGRNIDVWFDASDNLSTIHVEFDAENENSLELQKNGWQAILNNFKNYVELN
ncbi:MAG: SRPBCC domain-containing protein [Bacteroidia bacterium]|jgi:uncharacterized protein YndB with AHSA1/START domain|nr:SRPBCC domain-containing protein [Bacteroidia bacterium]